MKCQGIGECNNEGTESTEHGLLCKECARSCEYSTTCPECHHQFLVN